MKLWKILLLIALATSALGAESKYVAVVPVHGTISHAQFFFLRRALKEAARDQATAVILDLDTLGGDSEAAMNMMDALVKSGLPTTTFINHKAISAGALIAVATKQIYMSPNGVIGAAAPVTSTGEDLPSTMRDKSISALSAVARSASQTNGYNAELAEAFINKDTEVKIGDEVIHAKGSLLTLSAQEAARVIGDKPLLSSGTAASIDDLVRQLALTAPVKVIEPSGFERLAFWVTELAPLFLLIGIVGAYLEFKLQGTMLPGIVSAICFIIFFTGHYFAGLAGWEVFALFVAGVLLVIGELVLHPGTIITGALGVVFMLAAIVWAMVDRYPSEPFNFSGNLLMTPLLNLGIAIMAAGVVIALLTNYLPKLPFYDRISLNSVVPPGSSISSDGVASPARLHLGEHGIARSVLRPAGTAAFDDDLVLDVVTRGEFIDAGTPIQVLAVEGSRVVVESRA